MYVESEGYAMSPDYGIPIGSAWGDLGDYPWITTGTIAPGTVYTTPFYYNSAGTATYAWGGTSYVKFKATA